MARKQSIALKSTWLYDLILWIFSPLVGLFFREIQVRGAWRVPNKGAVILVAAPHANQFVDSVVLMRIMASLNRRISWLMAAKSFDKPIVGTLAHLISVVPVSRAIDNMKAGEGTILLPDPTGNPTIIKGIGTKFNGPDFEVGGGIYLPAINGESHKLEILEIHGPEDIILKSTPALQIAVQQLSSPNGISFKVAPHLDQTVVYDAVYDRLRKNGCIGIFPEGGSHDRPDMLPLKAGIAIMALGALAQNTTLTVVPVGLNYFHAHKFRSRAVVEFGDPIAISSGLVENFKSGKRRESVGELLDAIYQALAAITMAAPDFDTLMLVHAARRLYYAGKGRIPLPSVIEVNRRLVKGYTVYKSDPRIENLSKSITQYNRQLQLLGLHDSQVDYARFSVLRVLTSLVYRVGKLCILAIGTLPGLMLFSPIFIAARYYSHKMTREALAGSNVKIQGTDVMATWKILVAGGLAPLLYTYYATMLGFWTHYNRVNGIIPQSTSLWTVILAAYIIFPMLTFAALQLGEIGMDILKSLRPLFLCLSPFSLGTLNKLRERKAILSRQVTDLINTLGPDLFPDCEAAKPPQPRKLYSEVSPNDSLDDLADSEFFSTSATDDALSW